MQGFTLIETVLYIGILSLVLSALFASAAVLRDTSTYTRQEAETIQSELLLQDAADIGLHFSPPL